MWCSTLYEDAYTAMPMTMVSTTIVPTIQIAVAFRASAGDLAA